MPSARLGAAAGQGVVRAGVPWRRKVVDSMGLTKDYVPSAALVRGFAIVPTDDGIGECVCSPRQQHLSLMEWCLQ